MKVKGFVSGFIFLVFFIFQLAPQKAHAAVYGDGVHYIVSGEQATITDYTGIGGDVIIPEIITDDNGSYVVTAIGDQAFYGSNITGVTIPNSILTIGSQAFESSSALTEIVIPDSVIDLGQNAFYGCQSLRSAVIGNGVTEIKSRTFEQCFQLYNVQIGESVTSIGSSAFYYCGIVNLTIPDSVTNISDRAFMLNWGLTTLHLGANLETIGESVFYGNYFLTEVQFPDSLISIGKTAFFNNYSLSYIFIPASVTDIGNDAFNRCDALSAIDVDINNPVYSSLDGVLFDKLKSVLIKFPENKYASTYIIPDSVSTIGETAFLLSYVQNIVIPDNVVSISAYAFSNTRGMKSITIGSGVNSIGSNAFSGPYFTQIEVDNNNAAYSSLDGILYNKSKTTIICYPNGKEESTFDIPSSVTKIGNSAFEGSKKLVDISIPDSVNLIGQKAFFNCQALENVNVGNGVTNIDSHAFGDCFSLESIKFWGDAPILGEYVFSGTRAQFKIYYLSGKSGYTGSGIQADFSWTTPFYTVAYNGNNSTNGSSPIDSNTYLNSDTITVMDNSSELSKEGYTFIGWNTAQDGSGTTLLPGTTLTMGTENVILYAMWRGKLSPITSPKAQLLNGTTIDSSQTSMRFVSTIDSLEYSEVGFVISLNKPDPIIGGSGCVTKATKVVYTSINAGSSIITSESLGGKYIVALSLNNIPQDSFSKTIYVKPYVKSINGNISYGEKREFTVLDLLNK